MSEAAVCAPALPALPVVARVRSPYRPFGAFRLLLALIVVLQHQLHLLPAPSRQFFYQTESGVVAVAVFFVISGFIVTEANVGFYAGRPWNFLANRALRLLPCYFVCVAIAACAQSWLFVQGRFTPLIGPLTGPPYAPAVLASAVLEILPGLAPRLISGQDFSLIPFAWTLRVEAAFYLAAFLAAGSARHLRAAPALVIAIGYGAFFAAWWSEKGPQQLLFIPFFLLGIAGFAFWRRRSPVRFAHLLLALACVCLSFPCWHQRGQPRLEWQMPMLLGLLAGFLCLAFVRVPASWRRWDRRLGDLSYPLYLGHVTVLLLLADGGLPPGPALYVAGLVLSLLLAGVLHVGVEMPMRRLRDRLRGTVL